MINFVLIMLSVISFTIGFYIGKRKGAKDGIDYCFERYKEKFRNGCLESVEALMAEGKMYDIEYSRWIPVSERLPEKDENVLLTICANSSLYGFNENFVKVMCGSYSPCEDKRDWIVNEIRYYIDNVIAWMPLPKPPEEVDHAQR